MDKLRLLVVMAGALSALASSSSEAGDRAENGCPDDEDCSPDTPDGLYFTGARLGDRVLTEGVPATAVGGTQTVKVWSDEDAQAAFTGFRAAVKGTAFTAGSPAGNAVVLTGAASGEAYLRIVDAEGLLYDRIALQVAPAA